MEKRYSFKAISLSSWYFLIIRFGGERVEWGEVEWVVLSELLLFYFYSDLGFTILFCRLFSFFFIVDRPRRTYNNQPKRDNQLKKRSLIKNNHCTNTNVKKPKSLENTKMVVILCVPEGLASPHYWHKL